MKNLVVIFFLLLGAYTAKCQSKDTFEVYFPLNNAQLTKEASNYIDGLIFNDTLIHGNKLVLLGYADYVGPDARNDNLSMRRAKCVKDYLLTMGFEEKDIELYAGKGKIERTGMKGREGYAPDRKVQIVIDRKVTPPPPPSAQATPKVAPAIEKVDIANMAVNQTFSISSVCFEPGTPLLLMTSYPVLKVLLDYLKQYPTLRIRIEGHVCCVGQGLSDTYYQGSTLSQARAEAIRLYLINKGISAGRLDAIGLGNSNPVVSEEKTEEDRIKNRRVEIRILSK